MDVFYIANGSKKKWTKRKIIEKIKKLNNKSYSYVIKNYCSLFNASCKYFGSWGGAVEASGFNYNKIKKDAIKKI